MLQVGMSEFASSGKKSKKVSDYWYRHIFGTTLDSIIVFDQ